MTEKRYGRREKLPNPVQPHPATHAGLWLDKFLAAQGDDEAKKNLVKQVAETIKEPLPYQAFFERWKASLKQAGAQATEAEVKGRLAIHLGAESVLETSIALHRTYGVPYIPGSALKGLAASFAHQHLAGDEWHKETGQAHKELFGTTEQAGCVTFFDALYVPGSGYQHQALWPDIITVHHPDYYQGQDKPPADWDSPTPIPFLTATGKFLVALAGPDAWVETAFKILGNALAQEGIGAKTSSGYGRMELDMSALMDENDEEETQWYDQPSNDWDWREGRITGQYVRDKDDPDKRFPIDRGRIIPKEYTLPGKKKPVHYVVFELETGESIVWVKRFSYQIPASEEDGKA